MKKILAVLLALTMLLGVGALAEEDAPLFQQDVMVLFTSDVHCGIESNFGYAGLAMVRDAYKNAGYHVLLVDNGDSIQGEPVGTMTTGEANIKLMNAVGYDIATMGNHEFDYGMERFFELSKMANFPYVSCNFNKGGELQFAPYVVKEFDGVKIAFVGISTPKTLTSSTPKYFQDENGNFIGFINLIKRDARKKVNGKLEKCEMPEDKKDQVEVLRSMLIEVAAESSEELMEKFFNDEELTEEEIYDGLQVGIANHSIAPVMCGSATLGYGVKLLMNTIVRFTLPAIEAKANFHAFHDGKDVVYCSSDDERFSAYVFKTIADPYIGRLNLFRVMTGKLDTTMSVYNEEKDTVEKVGRLYVMRGKEQIEVDELHSGDIGALAKLSNTSTQDTLSLKDANIIIPKIALPGSVLCMAIKPKGKGDEDKLSAALTKIREEDPTIKMEVNPETKQTLVYGVGEQQLDVMVQKLKAKYKIEVDLTDPIIPYRETIKAKASVRGRYKKQSGGHGQFGDVVMEFEPSYDTTTPVIFEEKIFGGSVPKQYFPAVEKGLQECVQSGVLAGYPVVGLKATLTDGSYHPVDSSEMAFKMATSVAFKEGIPQAKPVILEPIEHVEVLIPDKYMGDIMGDITKRRGRILSMDAVGMKKCIVAEVPTAEMHKYATDLRSMTQSRGEYRHHFERYEEAPMEVQKKIIEARAAEKEK